MNDTSKNLTQEEMDDAEAVVKLLKQLSPKEKERALYMLQGAAFISDAVAAAKAVGA